LRLVLCCLLGLLVWVMLVVALEHWPALLLMLPGWQVLGHCVAVLLWCPFVVVNQHVQLLLLARWGCSVVESHPLELVGQPRDQHSVLMLARHV
jgi:UDP-N-acetyl-D-mannosaminuronate dehydrogenase